MANQDNLSVGADGVSDISGSTSDRKVGKFTEVRENHQKREDGSVLVQLDEESEDEDEEKKR